MYFDSHFHLPHNPRRQIHTPVSLVHTLVHTLVQAKAVRAFCDCISILILRSLQVLKLRNNTFDLRCCAYLYLAKCPPPILQAKYVYNASSFSSPLSYNFAFCVRGYEIAVFRVVTCILSKFYTRFLNSNANFRRHHCRGYHTCP